MRKKVMVIKRGKVERGEGRKREGVNERRGV